MEEVDKETGETHWTGVMSVYVDDLLAVHCRGGVFGLSGVGH